MPCGDDDAAEPDYARYGLTGLLDDLVYAVDPGEKLDREVRTGRRRAAAEHDYMVALYPGCGLSETALL